MTTKYYQKHRERLQKEARKNPEEQKQKLLEYMKNDFLAHKKVTV